jgi:hypothetical protein
LRRKGKQIFRQRKQKVTRNWVRNIKNPYICTPCET